MGYGREGERRVGTRVPALYNPSFGTARPSDGFQTVERSALTSMVPHGGDDRCVLDGSGRASLYCLGGGTTTLALVAGKGTRHTQLFSSKE
jgi:hypothetical protein